MSQLCLLFSNRTNLDPWDQYSDSQIWEALEKTHIKEMVSDKMVKHSMSDYPFLPNICPHTSV